MLKVLKTNRIKYNEALFLGSLTLFCFLLSIVRIFLSKSIFYIFLNWNLFLAFLPWFLSTYITINPHLQRKKIYIGSIVLLWILFFPNAPYILTDLIHLRSLSSMPVWFDLLMVLFFAWTGILYGFFSFWDIERILELFIKTKWRIVISGTLLFICGFGIYIGRYLRWNSWDIIIEPFALFKDIGVRFIDPFEYPNTWGMTILMGIFLNILYWSFKLINARKK